MSKDQQHLLQSQRLFLRGFFLKENNSTCAAVQTFVYTSHFEVTFHLDTHLPELISIIF